ncbi:MAG TPA: YncE family protein [Rhodocyclaceae bacterium]
MNRMRTRFAICIGLACAFAHSASAGAGLPLKHVAAIALPGPASRFDYQAYDPKRQLLFIAHLGAGTVLAFSTAYNKIVAEIPHLSQVHGVLAVPGEGMLYASATGTNEIVAIDEETLKEVARIPGGDYPDGMTYVPGLHKLYVSDERGGTATVIDTRTRRRIATIALGGEAGNSQFDPVSGHVFVNVQTRGKLTEIDPGTDRILARHALAGAQGNHGLLIDPERRLAFVACEGNARLLVVGMANMRVLQSMPVGAGPDVLAFDDRLRMLYVASESGVVSLFSEEGGGVRKQGEGQLARGAHSVAVVPETHRVYPRGVFRTPSIVVRKRRRHGRAIVERPIAGTRAAGPTSARL